MQEKTSWERFFDGHAPIYDQNVFTKNTIAEVEFLLQELTLRPGASILDVGCGTGRHAVELARRGYDVTGVDLSTRMLEVAAEAARAAGVRVEWLRMDATRLSLDREYDAAICLCEGAFGLLDRTDDPIAQPLSILRNISRSLRSGGQALLTVLNGAAMFRRHTDEDVANGRFDPLTLTESTAMAPREGLPEVRVRERAFAPTELRLLLRLAGLSAVHLWGGTAGNWGRRPLDLDEMEIMVVARKTVEPAVAADR